MRSFRTQGSHRFYRFTASNLSINFFSSEFQRIFKQIFFVGILVGLLGFRYSQRISNTFKDSFEILLRFFGLRGTFGVI